MISFKQLLDPRTGTCYHLDSHALFFRISSDGAHKETRLKPHYAQILAVLFASHPKPAPYKTITHILKHHHLACPDETRLHRKISELRVFLTAFDPELNHLICNIRGIGYSLPLHLKDPETDDLCQNPAISNKKIKEALLCLEEYAKTSIVLSKRCNIKKMGNGYVLHRQPAHRELEHLLENYEKQKKKIYTELRLHSADFLYIRLDFLFAKLKTYLGLARISEFSITKDQWLEWHETETKQILADLIFHITQVVAT